MKRLAILLALVAGASAFAEPPREKKANPYAGAALHDPFEDATPKTRPAPKKAPTAGDARKNPSATTTPRQPPALPRKAPSTDDLRDPFASPRRQTNDVGPPPPKPLARVNPYASDREPHAGPSRVTPDATPPDRAGLRDPFASPNRGARDRTAPTTPRPTPAPTGDDLDPPVTRPPASRPPAPRPSRPSSHPSSQPSKANPYSSNLLRGAESGALVGRRLVGVSSKVGAADARGAGDMTSDLQLVQSSPDPFGSPRPMAAADGGTDSPSGPVDAGDEPDAGGTGAPVLGTGSGSGAGSADPGAGSGGRVIQLPSDVMAPTVNAAATPTALRLGGRFTLIITATFAAGVEVNLEEPLDLGPAFEVRKKLSEDRPSGDGRTVREWQIDVLAWELGDLKIAPIAVTYTVAGKVGQVPTNMVRLRVDGVLGEAVDDPKLLRDVQPPTALITRDWFWLVVVGASAAGVFALALGMWLRSRMRRRRVVSLTRGAVMSVPARRLDMTSQKALEALLAIESSGVLERDDDRRAGYAEMVDVIREYLGARYRVATRDLTSSELARRLAHVAPEDEAVAMDAWLERCDLVKYGGLRPKAAEAMVVLADARELVVMTSQPARAAAVVDEESVA